MADNPYYIPLYSDKIRPVLKPWIIAVIFRLLSSDIYLKYSLKVSQQVCAYPKLHLIRVSTLQVFSWETGNCRTFYNNRKSQSKQPRFINIPGNILCHEY